MKNPSMEFFHRASHRKLIQHSTHHIWKKILFLQEFEETYKEEIQEGLNTTNYLPQVDGKIQNQIFLLYLNLA